MNRLKGLMPAIVAFALGLGAQAADISWVKTVYDGIYTNDANWSTGVFPAGPSEAAFFDLGSVNPPSGEVRIGFEGDVTDANRVCVRVVKEGIPLVFAVTNGASWYKGPGAFYNDAYKSGFALCQSSGQTGDNLSIRSTTANTIEPCFLMSDALLSYTINATTGNRISFSKGTWNWYDPSGNEADSPANTMYVGYGNGGQVMPNDGLRFDIADDATLRGRNLVVSQHTMAIAGGDHTLFGSVQIGNLQKGTNTLLAVSGGTVGVTNGVIIGAKASSNRSIDNTPTHTLALAGSAKMDVQGDNPATVMTEQMYAHSRLAVSDSATYRTRGFIFGNAGSSTLSAQAYLAQLLVEGDATFITWQGGTVGNATSAMMTLKDNALFEQEGDNSLTFGSYNKLWLKDSAVMLAGGPVSFGGTSSEVVLEGSSAFKMVAPARGALVGNGHLLTIGSTSAEKVRLTVRDNAQLRQYQQSASTYIYGKDTVIELAGGVTEWPQPLFFGTSDPNGDCRMRVSGGTHYIGRVEEKNLNYNTSLGYTTAGTRAVFEQTGGTVVLATAGQLFAANGGAAVATTGRVELAGGVFSGKLAGGTSAACRGGAGRAELYANGGTLQTIAAAGTAYIENIDEAVLGEKGLTFDSTVSLTDPRADVKQAFTDEPGQTGRFIKTGTGVVRLFKASAHGETVVAGGTALVQEGVGEFGRSLVVTNDATLALAGSIAAERLTLGDAATAGTLQLPADAVVTLTGDDAFSAANGKLDYASAEAKGTYTIFRLKGEVNRAAFLKLALVQASGALHYAFQFKEDEGDTLVQLVTYTINDVTPATWQGETGVFETPGNWNEGTAPGVTGQAVFTSDAPVQDVTLAQQTTVDSLVFAGGEYTLRGDDLLKTFGIQVSGGTAEVLPPLFAVGSLALQVAAGTELTLGGAFDGNFAAEKTGKGLLSVASEASTAKSDWTLSGGTTAFEHPEAIGAGTLTVGHATLRFTGEGETDAEITVDSGAGQAAVVDAVADVTINGGFTTTSGGTLKTGAGALNVNFPAGTFELAKDELGIGKNAIPGNTSPDMQPVPDDGEVVCNDGLAGFTVREGAVRLTGAGKDVTTVKSLHWTLVGGKWTNDVADAELELANLTFDNANTDYRRIYVGLRTFGTYLHPMLRVLDGADLKTQGLLVGSDSGDPRHWYPTFEITNATATIGSSLYVGRSGSWHPYCHPTIRILAGADVYVSGISMTLGIAIGGNSDVLVDGGVLRTTTGNAGILVANTGSGSVRVRNGGALRVTGIMSPDAGSHAATTNFTVLVDGGTLEILASGATKLVDPQKRQVEMGESGGTVCVGDGLSYAFRFPIKGAGALTKTGAGELVVGVGSNYNGSASGLVTGQWTGLTTVAEGTLTFEETESVAGRAFAVAEGATLDLGGYTGALAAVSGAGKVRNATVTGLKIQAARPDETPVMTELDMTLSGRVMVDFGVPKTEEIARPAEPVPVAKLAPGMTFNAANWKAKNCGKGNAATFSCKDGIVYATFCDSFGLLMIVR